jgi:hypothetical protein
MAWAYYKNEWDQDCKEDFWGVRRGKGRPRLRWIGDVEDDLRNMGMKRWGFKALDRAEWASIIKEAKAKLKGP